jgi:ATP-binding cassette subfamily B protein
MLKLAKLLKKSIFPLLIVVALLALQAFCDLSLPTYTSDIVDVGIQQGGIESPIPDAIREKQLKSLLFMMDVEEQGIVLDSYTLLSKEALSSEDYQVYLQKYPILSTENIFILDIKDIDKTNQLSEVMGNAMSIVYSVDGQSEQAIAMREQLLAQVSSEMSEYSTIEILSTLPTEQSDLIISGNEAYFAEMPATIREQSAIVAVKAEYEAIGIDSGSLQTNYVLVAGAKMLGLALLSMISTILVGFMSAKIAASLGRDLRSNVFKKVIAFSNSEFDKFSTASLITRSTNDIQQIQMMLVFLIRIVFYSPILAIGGVIKVLNTNVSMTWIIALAVVIIMGIVGVLFAVAMPKFKLMQKLVDRLNLVTREILTGLSVIRAFNKEQQEEKRFDIANKDLTKTNLFVTRVMQFMMPLMMLIMNGITILILWNGGKGIDNGSMQVGDLMAFIQYTMQIIMSFLMFTMISIMLPRASVSAGRINEVLETDITIRDPESEEAFVQNKKGYVEFENVSFRYPKADDYVLSNITFTAKPGETTAIIGSTGCGKSTLIHLIPRFYDVSDGSIKVDGVDVRNLKQHTLRGKLGFVPQKGVLFSGTIDSNIRYGKQDATTEEVLRATRIAQAMDFIEEKTDKFESSISQGGGNVSGGQKQRLSIARAIAKDPEIFIFDDSFSALDYKTDVVLRKALKAETTNSTVIIVAQRISTILHADQIIVLDEGKIVGIGKHRELLKNCEVYKQIASSQLSKEELAYE